MLEIAILGVLALVILLLVAPQLGWKLTVATVALLIMALPPRGLGDAALLGVPLTTHMVAVVGLAALAALSGTRSALTLRFVPLVVFLVLLGPLAWTFGTDITAGTSQLLVGVLAWIAGSYVATLARSDLRSEQYFAALILAIVSFQAVVAVLQFSGLDVFATASRTAELTLGRATGTYGHPGTLGKVIVLLAVFVLPLMGSAVKRVRTMVTLTLLIAIVPIGLSESRSNIASLLALLGLWVILLPREKALGARIVLPAGALVIAMSFYETIATRFALDPLGGERDHFMSVALTHIPENLLFGVGPKTYIPYFGQYDSLTAQGWPVHNVFVLELAEIGLIGAALLFIPAVVAPAVSAVTRLKSRSPAGYHARAIIAALPAIIIIGTTGWGLIDVNTLPLWFFVYGYLDLRARGDVPPGATILPADTGLSAQKR
ncbi:O-antigen ligase family protein [Microbacterium sp. E-13]|uniref:O-antigen ligase family protein n=1 Tax=Microbacterium sp. E-13 TaxID=3404048 RepID=UPI003CFA27EF